MPYLLKDSIGYRTNLIATAVKMNFTKVLQSKFSIAAEQFATLKIIDEEGSVTQTRIAELLEKDKTTVGRSIESLLKKELINIENVQNDRRANKVSLSVKGQVTLNNAVPISKRFNDNLKSKLNKEEIEIFFKVLDIIHEESKNIK